MNKKRSLVIGLAGLVLLTALFSSSPKSDRDLTNQNLGATGFSQLLGLNSPLSEEVLEEGVNDRRILVIPVEGTIGLDSATYSQDHLLASIDQIAVDDSIQAVLLRIDSPGGGVYATRELYDRFKEVLAERDIPIYVSMGSVAASGGYYLSALGDKIFASEETITGSLGVIMSGYNTSGLLEKLGVEPTVYKSGAMKDILSSTREATEEEKAVLQSYIDESYQRFLDVIKEGRQMPEEEVRKLADGRIYSGSQAKTNGLIDELGYEKDALAALRADHDLANAQVFTLINPEAAFKGLFPGLPGFLGKLGLTQDQNPASQLDQVIERIEGLDNLKLEYRMEGGY